MFDKYRHVREVLALFLQVATLKPLRSQWTTEHCVFASDIIVHNKDSTTVVGVYFVTNSTCIEIETNTIFRWIEAQGVLINRK